MHPNVKAFLDMLAVSEGTYGRGDDGYNVLAGGDFFYSYHDHPRTLVKLRPDLASTAAGRYQILARIYDAYKKLLGLPDFSPASQDAIVLKMLYEQGAMEDIREGRFFTAVDKVKNIWASLPGAGYGQPENHILYLAGMYQRFNGVITEDVPKG